MLGNLSFLKQRTIQILVFGYALFLLYWIWVYTTGQVGTTHNYILSIFSSGILPVFGGISGILLSRKWGFLSSALGKAIFFLSAGVLAYGLASLIWGYYNLILAVDTPYPSLADAIYILSYPFWAIGLINLGKGIGAGYKLRTLQGKIALVLTPIVGAVITYLIFILFAQGGGFSFEDSGIIKIFFDIFYPLGDTILITALGLIYGLSYKAFGGRFKSAINILFIGFLITYFADAIFSYTTTQGTYYTSDWVDTLFVTSMFLIAMGVNAMDIQGISSRVRSELVMFAPRANEAINNLVLEIIQRQVHIIGPVAWDEAVKVQGITIDAQKNSISVTGDPKVVLEQLTAKYEELFGNASLQICKEATRKFISQVPQEQIPEALR
ncbi:MAG: hypothetical protein A3E61_02265 [Candidatus Colwellbacteria bacterium RIFCSPHIGHO2_12_FULL_43_12]|uniref:Uncharacterized protein n=3 Tax=Candidatus Colwelliibacteriota TaxID=1817904 RepID=A0A1G1Z0V0_9BACT|nr:MAG: hypothetical protein A3D47_02040 [Candidatus Colwellbacteria bacterium RIFCSPHIGHO2_02_FULL_43_15]OGY58914.1 MAG: hypothetical protein A3E61_02265 [Candidatus Colwellbacteria bacterium RIFCSPHIGHO2_12_FULL_43_12]OGY61838.1 MAG: hypothetical protein A3F99_02215 [Candidatus Colwellbacteria bacterium RIFCSPLOWO2_12_FULL_43_11]